MSLKLLAWNIEGRLSPFATKGRGAPDEIVKAIIAHDADVVFLAEAADGDNVQPETIAQLEQRGYAIHTAVYNDVGERYHVAEENPVMKLMSRTPVHAVRTVRYGGTRTMIVADVIDPETGSKVRLLGIHLDDRSEANRLQQVVDVIKEINDSSLPCVALGDFNALHKEDFRSRLLHSWLFSVVARIAPRGLTRDIFHRVYDMADGRTLVMLQAETNLVDADGHHRPTATPKLRGQEWLPSVRLIQLDHIFVSSKLQMTDFYIAGDGGSDHRALTAVISAIPVKH